MRVAQLDRATGYGPVGRGFESFHARGFERSFAVAKDLFLCNGKLLCIYPLTMVKFKLEI